MSFSAKLYSHQSFALMPQGKIYCLCPKLSDLEFSEEI